MSFKKDPQVYPSSIKETVIGTGDKAVTLGGENTLVFYSFDAPMKNKPAVGIMISDKGVDTEIPGIAEFFGADTAPAAAAAKADAMSEVDFIALKLESSDPNGDDAPAEDCAATAKAVADAITKPLVVLGSDNIDKDKTLLGKVAEALDGKNALLMSAKEENYKQVAVSAVQAYGQKISAESAVDINLAKQLNVLIGQMGISGDNMVMNVGQSAVGYGYEYLASAMERIKLAALTQNDEALQVPIITPIADDAWSVKEAIAPEDEMPEWGASEERGIGMEISSAAATLAAGANAVILRHPESIKTISKMIDALM